MNEAQRQRYLKALGLTPWVARTPLPGAAPSPVLDWREEAEAAPAQVAVATPVAAPQRPAPVVEPEASPDAESATEAGAPSAPPPRAEPAPAAPVSPERALTFTLEAHLAGDTWVVFQQEDAQAPGLGRHTGALAASLLAVFGAGPSRPRRFYCPLTDQPMDGEQAAQALGAFFGGLVRNQGGSKVLLCLEEPLASALFGVERYRSFALGELSALAVSSLGEMLAEPAAHKASSWRAMRAQGFDGRNA